MRRQVFFILLLAAMFLTACGPPSGSQKLPPGVDATVEATVPLAIGSVPLRLLITKDNAPLTVSNVRVVGDMTHAGMVPVVSEVITRQNDGSYLAEDFVFTMAGDWFVQLDFTLSTGEEGATEVFFTIPAQQR